jgi:microsomal dipeptidase-like Zn-dependent dipeptidase
VQKTFPTYVPPEDRDISYKITPEMEEEAETALTEIIEEIEETETLKVQEHLEIDHDFDYGISLDVCLNVEEITDEVIEKFVRDFKANTLSLDNTLYSFTSEEEN